ncbi:MAG: Hpt domain-containing protein [Candidatus Muiribacterium halophilum]|mgnify:CR=1 FL=1|uniref:Hpt domain-containing protein n=1 Tax=Muiribacterium halophilum TaxID=2053465 RepID=A0A2N5ZBU6_MUIH1|nr:MAG: Hpt domain-containing protein [Candidatus Muirbacterium halophilum]
MNRFTVEVDIDLKEFIPDFIEGKVKSFKDVSKLIENKDYEGIYKIGHGLKGTGSAYGFDFITEFGKRLESLSKEKDDSSIQKLCDEALEYLDKIDIKYVVIE